MKKIFKNPESVRKFIIFIGDVLMMVFTISLVLFIHSVARDYFPGYLRRPFKMYAFYPSAFIYLIILYVFEMYEIRQRYEKLHIIASLLLVASVSFLAVFASAKIFGINRATMFCLSAFFTLSILFLYLWRLVFIRLFLGTGYFIKNVLLLGRDPVSEDIMSDIENSDYRLFKVIDDDAVNISVIRDYVAAGGQGVSQGSPGSPPKVDVAVIAMQSSWAAAVMKEVYKYKRKGIEVYDSASFYEIVTRKVAIRQYLKSSGMPYVGADILMNPVFMKIKRFLDFAGALFLLLLCLPLFLLIGLLVKITSGSPVVYLQERVGFNERPFSLIKFRTMVKEAESKKGPQWASKGDERVTRLGAFLRKTRLDELPQLINVIKGDMSFIGPRPIRRHFAVLIEETVPFYSLRFNVKPGLTGWAQVHYDYGGSIEGHIEKFQYDLYYIKHASVFLELFIVLKTLQTLIRRPAY